MTSELRTIFGSCAVFILLCACGQSAHSPATPPAAAAKPDVIVTYDGKRRRCVVALSSEAQGNSIACGEVVAFVKDELRVDKGSSYDIRSAPGDDQAEIAALRSNLNTAGYRFIGTQ